MVMESSIRWRGVIWWWWWLWRGLTWWWWWLWMGVAWWHDDGSSSLHSRFTFHYSDHISGYCIPYLVRQFGQFSSNVYKDIIDDVGLFLNKFNEPFFVSVRWIQTAHGVDLPVKSFRLLDLDMNISCGFILCCFPFCLLFFSLILGHLSTLCHLRNNEVDSRSRIRVPPGGSFLIYQF